MPKLNEEQLRFFMNEVLGLFEWSEEEDESDIDPLEFVRLELQKMKKEVARLSGVSVYRKNLVH